MTRCVRLTLFALLGSGPGCGNQTPVTSEFHEYSGTVAVQGKPADRVGIYFQKVDPAVGRDDVCQVVNGKYALKLVAGKYKVYFQSAGGTAIPKQYQSPATSGFELDASSKDGEQNFDLK
jgi:hypothetical protein